MRHCIFLYLAVFLSSCSRTTYSLYPSFGYELEDANQLIVAKFQNAPNDAVSENTTDMLVNLYRRCDQITVMPYDTVQDIFYRNVSYTDPIWKVDSIFMTKLYQTTKAQYLLVGGVVGESESKPPVSFAESYGNGQMEDRQQNWIMLRFTLYDLADSRQVFELHTRTKAGRYSYQRQAGAVSFHAPVALFSKALEKSLRKLPEACSCN